jgi:hypothetical protein
MSSSVFLHPAWIKVKRIAGSLNDTDNTNFFFININSIESFIPFSNGNTQITMSSGSILNGFISSEELIRKISAATEFLEREKTQLSSKPFPVQMETRSAFPQSTLSE